MSLPTIEPLPDENASLPPARRRRQRRMMIPAGSGERADFLRELARRTIPSFDFFLFSLLAGLVLGVALLIDAPALVFLAVLLAPFMAPAVGVSLGTIGGNGRFVLQSMGSLGIGSLIVFLCGTVAGWAANLLPAHLYQQAASHSQFTWPDFAVLLIGAGLTSYLTVRIPHQKPLVASAAIAYELYLPAGVAGFGLSSAIAGLWPDALWVFLIHLVWAIFISTVALILLKLPPLNASGYLLLACYAAVGILTLSTIINTQGSILPQPILPTIAIVAPATGTAQAPAAAPSPSSQPTQTISPAPATDTPLPTSTRTLVSTRTPTMTITPAATPAWARINASEGGGALIRSKPSFDSEVVQSLLNGTLVEVLPDVEISAGITWLHVRTTTDKEGWIVRELLRTATPAPG